MSLTAGIVGLPNVGKSTLFNAITKSTVLSANYPFATIEPNVGVVEVKDARLDEIVKIVQPKNTVYTTFSFTDIAGLVKGASLGEGLGNQFLANIREVDAIVQVVRCFEDDNIIHVSGTVDPVADIEIINMELIFADLEVIEKRISRVAKKALARADVDSVAEYEGLMLLKEKLSEGVFAQDVKLSATATEIIKGYNLLTAKPMIYVLNVGEDDISRDNKFVKQVEAYVKDSNQKTLVISAKIEEELSELDDLEKQEFLMDLGIQRSGLEELTLMTYDLLGLQTYFTAGPKEARAWTFPKGAKAPQCAGIIHTDFERGFIKAEVISYQDYISFQGEKAAKEAGKVRLEGKEYVVQDGDVILFRFNV